MSTRRELLTHLFRLLEVRQVPYCVLRNYEDLFEDSSSDVDLLTEPNRATEVIECCIEAGTLTGQSLVQRTRFVNHSLVFWNGEDGFTRIDIDTEKRWRRYHMLTATQVLSARKRFQAGGEGSFFVPDIKHEAVIVLAQAMWQGKLTERYAKRLLEIRAEVGDNEHFRNVFQQAFGLSDNLLAMVEDPHLVNRLQKAAARDACLRPHKICRSLGYIFKDVARLVSRRRSLPGSQVRLVGLNAGTAEKLAEHLAVLFPLKKRLLVSEHASKSTRQKALFKGGMVVESMPAADKPAALLRDDWVQPACGFAAVQDGSGMHLIHTGTGFMSQAQSPDELARFMCETLAHIHTNKSAEAKGAFVVLLGLDGSGKTTLARRLIVLASKTKTVSGVRYFHWLPSLGSRFEFPLPEPGNQPRKTERPFGALHSLLSAARLARNIIRAQLAWWLRLRPLCNRGHLVIADRYFYNYHLDPLSVKYFGPRWLLALAGHFFPKPDVVITLNAPPEILLSRKQELSKQQIYEQAATLEKLDFGDARVIRADATESPEVVANKVMDELVRILSQRE